jgi:predicted Rossmann fold nucleotide-binding protein DprA/Smf involved in DNA uptake
MAVTTKDNLAQIVLCSDLGYDPNDEKTLVRPLTAAAWGKIEDKLRACGYSPSVFLTEKLADVANNIGLSDADVSHIEKLLLRSDKLGAEIDRLAEMKIFITTRTADNDPSKMRRALGHAAPVLLYFCGEMCLIERQTTAIIGSRTATEQENEYAAKHARISAQNGVTVISGGARGIDTVAKEAALKAGGNVVTFVSDSMTKYIQTNASHILWDKMLVLSAFNPEVAFRGYNALERNKFIYASSDYAVVVSSGNGTGGSFKGAADCLKHRLTKLYVKDDAFAPEGNKKLIEMGGLPVNEAHERLEPKA